MDLGMPLGTLLEACVAPLKPVIELAYHCYLPRVKLQMELNSQGFDVSIFDEVIIA